MNRSTLLLLALLLGLGAVVLLVLPSEEEKMASYTKPSLSFAVDSASVIGVEIRRPQGDISIENIGGRWTITSPAEYAADPAAVSSLIGSFSRFRPGSLISDNPSKQDLFQVDSTGTFVTLTERSGDTHSIIIGKMGPSFSEVYFRLPDQSDVYLGSGITSWSLEKELKEWRDRTIYAAASEAITGVSVKVGTRTVKFDRDSTGWKSNGGTVDNETINPVLTALSQLKADDFIDSAVEFSGRPSEVVVTGARGVKLDFFRLASDTSKYAVQSSTSPQKFIVSSYTASRLLSPAGVPRATAASGARPTPSPAVKKPAVTAESGSTPAKATPQPEVKPAEVRTTTPPPPPDRARAGDAVATPPKTEAGKVNPFKQRGDRESKPADTRTRPARDDGTQQPPVRSPDTVAPDRDKVTTPPVRRPETRTPAREPEKRTPDRTGEDTPAKNADQGDIEDEGELTIHVVKRGETMTSIAGKYGVSVEQILKWNLLKSISVKPGQELYVFVRQ